MHMFENASFGLKLHMSANVAVNIETQVNLVGGVEEPAHSKYLAAVSLAHIVILIAKGD